MALLLLWEVDHGQLFPRQGGDGPAAALLGFTRRLKARVQQDAELSQWLTCRHSQRPLADGLPATYHMRWSVRIVKPPQSEPQGWYEEFVRRWRQYLEGLVNSAAPALPSPDIASSSGGPTPLAAPAATERNPGTARRRSARPNRPTAQPTTVPSPALRPHKEEPTPRLQSRLHRGYTAVT